MQEQAEQVAAGKRSETWMIASTAILLSEKKGLRTHDWPQGEGRPGNHLRELPMRFIVVLADRKLLS